MKKIELFVALLLVISMAFVILSCNNDRTVDTDTMYTGTEQISTESEVKTRETVKTVETADTAETEETTDTTEMTSSITTEITIETESQTDEPAYIEDLGQPSIPPLVFKSVSLYASFDFSLPDKESRYNDEFGCIEYCDVDEDFYKEFIEVFRKENFTIHEHNSSNRSWGNACLFRDDCIVYLCPNKSSMLVQMYQKSVFAPDNALSSVDVKQMLCPENTLSKIELVPVDVTPEGFFERTGGQIFAVPVYRNDEYFQKYKKTSEYEDCYYVKLYYVKNNQAFVSDYEEFAVYDVNHDGTEEVLVLGYGWTSLLYTFNVAIISDEWISDSFFIPEKIFRPDFFDNDGVLTIGKRTGESFEQQWQIVIEIKGETRYVYLENDDGRMKIWGPQNTRFSLES